MIAYTVQILDFKDNCLLIQHGRLYAIPVRQASALPAASFRFNLTVDTLAVRLTVPSVGPVRDLSPAKLCQKTHPQVSAPCRAHKEKGDSPSFILFLSCLSGNHGGHDNRLDHNALFSDILYSNDHACAGDDHDALNCKLCDALCNNKPFFEDNMFQHTHNSLFCGGHH